MGGFTAALDDDFNTPEAFAILHDWRDDELLRRGLALFGLESPGRGRRAGGGRRARRDTRRARAAHDFDEADRLRGEIEAAGWEVRDEADGFRLIRDVTQTRELVYGRTAARELLPRAAQVLETWVTERSAAQIPWLDAGPRPQLKPERLLSEAAGTRDHQGRRLCEPYRYVDAYELAKRDAPLIVCLDQVPTAQPWRGRAERRGVGATGVVVPAHGSVRVTPAVCRASAGAVEHLPVASCRISPGTWRTSSRTISGRTLPTPRARWRSGTRSSLAVSRSCSGQKERACAAVRRTCDATVSIPLAGKVGSLNVSVAAAVLLFEARRQRGAADG